MNATVVIVGMLVLSGVYQACSRVASSPIDRRHLMSWAWLWLALALIGTLYTWA